jgi:mRNA interferase MazF
VVSLSRGAICWADFGTPRGSAPGYRRPFVVISSDRFNRSRISTVIVVAVTTSARAAAAPGNVALAAAKGGLDRDGTINVSQLLTLDRADLEEPVAHLDLTTVRRLDEGLRLVLSLG